MNDYLVDGWFAEDQCDECGEWFYWPDEIYDGLCNQCWWNFLLDSLYYS